MKQVKHALKLSAPDMILAGNTPAWCLQDGTVTTIPQYRMLCRNCESLQERSFAPHYCLACGVDLHAETFDAQEAKRVTAFAINPERN